MPFQYPEPPLRYGTGAMPTRDMKLTSKCTCTYASDHMHLYTCICAPTHVHPRMRTRMHSRCTPCFAWLILRQTSVPCLRPHKLRIDTHGQILCSRYIWLLEISRSGLCAVGTFPGRDIWQSVHFCNLGGLIHNFYQ